MMETRASDTTELSFAHLSDPHLTCLDGVHWRQLANKRLLGYLSWRQRRHAEHRREVLDALVRDLHQARPGQIIVTGDLTQLGLPDEFRQARQWLEQLGGSDCTTVIPGNHDAYIRTDWNATYAQWLPYMQSDSAYRQTGVTGKAMFPTLRIRKQVALIGLSSAVPSAPFLATGTLGRAQRERLVQLLRMTREQGLFRLVLLHHPPRIEDEKWRKRLTDGRALCAILGREGAELVLHGHGHYRAESAVPSEDGDIPVFGIPSASAIGHKPGRRAQYWFYRVQRCTDHWSVQIRVHAYQLESQCFEPQQELHLSRPVMSSTRR